MPKKKRKKQKEQEKGFSLHKQVKRAIWIVLFFTLSLVFFLSLIDYAGPVGTYLAQGLTWLFGWGVWVFPIVLLLVPLFLIASGQIKYQTIKISALFLFVFVYSALLNIRQPLDNIMQFVKIGSGGGYLGLVLYYPLMRLTGFWVSLIILVALGTIALFLMFETKMFKLGQGLVWLFHKTPGVNFLFKFPSKLAEKIKIKPEFVEEIKPKPTQEELLNKENLEEDEDIANTKEQPETTQDSANDSDQKEISKNLFSKYRRKIDIPLSLLERHSGDPSSGDIRANKDKIQKALENFGIEVEMGDTSTGPTVTQYTLKPQEGVKLSQITALNNDLALALAVHPIRIEAPIPGKPLVGIEVPNKVIATVGLRGVLQSKNFRRSRKSNLTLAFGRDVAGNIYINDLAKMPHLLIAGATGSGKSICINSSIVTLLYQNSPDDLKFILVDPKRVELSVYNGIPHLLTPVITDAKKTINALRWTVEEMDRRYNVLAEAGKKNLEAYNRSGKENMPYIIVVIDELADLMSVAAKEVEALIVRLAQMARAVGIHLILATQRPSVNVITGLIKANITARVAFAVASQTDSRTILDSAGAEKLLGRGDMLFINASLSKPKRLQGAFVSDKEIKALVNFLKEAAEPDYLEEIVEKKDSFLSSASSVVAGEEEDDELLSEARELVIAAGKASASYLQRHLRIGYARAARLLDFMEAEGLIGPSRGSKPREVLTDQAEENTKNNNE